MNLKDVDTVEVMCLVDNNVDVLLPNSEIARRPILARNWYEKPLVAEHGFCAALTLNINGERHGILFDSGLDPFAASHNADVLGFDLSYSDSLISSHGHTDHTGGLVNLRKKMNTAHNIPLIIHEDGFKNRLVKFQDGRTINLPAPDQSLLSSIGYEIVKRNFATLWIGDRVLVTGEIPRANTFEKGFSNHYSEMDNGKMEADPLIRDDQAIILSVKDKGLVIITGCGHSGIVNTISYAKQLTGQDQIYCVLGGMHLSGRSFEPIIPQTLEELERLKPRYVVPCHCSGLKAVTEIARRMPHAFIQNSVGTTYIF